MKIIKKQVFEGKNIYSHKKVMRIDVDLEGYSEIPSKDIKDFNKNLLEMIPELYEHRCGIDVEHGFAIRLKEGTYLSHICEHMVIAIHNRLGVDIAYGKAREIEGDLYYIIFQYQYKNLGLAIVSLAVEIINGLIKGKKISLKDRIEILKSIRNEEMMGTSTKSIYDEAIKANMPVLSIGDGIYQIGYGKQGRMFGATIGDRTRCLAVDICCDKNLTKTVLSQNAIPVAKGAVIHDTIQLLKTAENIGYPVVIKPQFGNKGNGVHLNIKNERSLLEAYNDLRKSCDKIIVEEYVEGNDYRVCVVNYEVRAVSKRTPPYVIGDGKASIKELIEELNSNPLRGEDHEKPLTKIKLDKDLSEILSKVGKNINSVVEEGEKIYLRENANISTGGFAEDCTDLISEENKKLLERVAKIIGLDICGIDISTKDISGSLHDNGIVIEVNAAPGIRMHEYPTKGKSRNVARDIINTMYDGNIRNIPLISITGTNGKTTTTRLISYVLSLMGYKVGMTSTDGIYIDNELIHKGDDTGGESAKTVLLNRDVDVAVLETARGGLVRKGLAYDLADVGVVTNIKEDHLGIDGIETLDQLAFAKALVIEAVKPTGYSVINADDDYCEMLMKRSKGNIILFSGNKDNKYILENMKKGKPVVYRDDDFIVVNNNNKNYKICDLKMMPLTLEGALKHNIYNSLAACAALVGLGIDYVMIAKGFLQFKSDENFNCGRFNIYNVDGIEIILDYGHNIDGYKMIIDSLKAMKKEKVIGIIGVPGDRNNKDIEEVGKLSGEYFNKIFIKEDEDKRGRSEGEVAELLAKGVKRASNENYKIILNEKDALINAFTEAKKGDTIILFFEDFDKVRANIDLLKNTKEKEA
ncbi:cyanophycin synthetase [Clostridium massiliamazoniense]|uniref:cyanophycin synthetase n=1 Tax=Clostridium massiliamazoniense TaxID=1347366 RepID=UPI0006D79692|nr:cyanophycin synthetase [Clostridium massiliamazoniense]